MFIRWTSYSCPSCGAHIESRLVSSRRVGIEHRRCQKCGVAFRTPDREWQNMTRGERLGYFLSETTVAWLGTFALSGALVQDGPWWIITLEGLALGVAVCTPFWLYKLWAVRCSLKRCPLPVPTVLFCVQCGRANVPGSPYCACCGAWELQRR